MIETGRPPYPGLRPFERNESDLFFGRDSCVDLMIARLRMTRFLAVLGSSGTGKSSLVKTGLFSALEMGLLAGSRWRIVEFRPGGDPLGNLAKGLLRSECDDGKHGTPVAAEVEHLKARFKREGPRELIAWCGEGHLPEGTNLLLLVDQFEELFRFQSEVEREEAQAFVSLLLESRWPRGVASPQDAKLPIYVTITMRSEYLGACALVLGLAEAINEGTYLIPRMTREQCEEAILGPALVCNIAIEPLLVTKLLNDITDFAPWEEQNDETKDQFSRLARRADQLPLLQHALNQIWEEAKGRPQPIELTLADYEKIGGLQGAVDKHGDQVLSQLEAKLGKTRARAITETVFRSITSGTTAANAVRHPTPFGTLVRMCDGDDEGPRSVIEAFRAPGCNFLTPEPSIPLLWNTFIDISHESLIRQWSQLSTWLVMESRAALSWHRLVDAAESYRRGEGGLLRGRNLDTLVSWRDDSKPSAEWASRYGGDFAASMGFLNESVRKQKATRAAIAALAIGIFAIGGYITYYMSEQDAARRVAEAEINSTRTAKGDVEAARDRLNKNIQRTAEFVLTDVAAQVRFHQIERHWNDAWNWLSLADGGDKDHIQNVPGFIDQLLAEKLNWRALEQYTQASSDAIEPDFQALYGNTLQELNTSPNGSLGRFGLLSSTSFDPRLYLFDKISGSILARSDVLDDAPKNTQSDLSYQYLSQDGQHAVVVLQNGEVLHWNTAVGNRPTPVRFDVNGIKSALEKAAKSNPIKVRDIQSIALDSASNQVALILSARDQSPQIIFSLGGMPSSPPIEIATLLDKNQKGMNDFAASYLVGFTRGQLVVELHRHNSSDGLIVIDTTTGHKWNVLEWNSITEGSRITPDGRAVIAIPDWDSDHGCQTTAGDLFVAPEVEAHGYEPGSCLAILDLETGRATVVARIPSESSAVNVSRLPTDSLGMRGYQVLLKIAGQYSSLEIESVGDGTYRLRDQANIQTSLALPNRLVSKSTWPLPVVAMPSITIANGGAKIIASTDSEDEDSPLTITKYSSRLTSPNWPPTDLEAHTWKLQLRSKDLKISRSHLGGAFTGDGHFLLLVSSAIDKPESSSDNAAQSDALSSTAKPVPQKRRQYWAYFNTDSPLNAIDWRPINTAKVGSCRNMTSQEISFVDIRYWGQQSGANTQDNTIGQLAFIAIDVNNHLWKLSVSLQESNQSIDVTCLGELNGDAKILDVDGSHGLAVVRSNSIYVYSLSQQDQASQALSLPGMPVAAAFTGPSNLALAMLNGDIWLAELTNRWATKPALNGKGVVSQVARLAADNKNLLVIAQNGYAVSLSFDGDSVRPNAILSLPRIVRNTLYHFFDSKDNAVYLLRPGTLDIYHLSALPNYSVIRALSAARGSILAESERNLTNFLMSLAGNDGLDASPSSNLISLNASLRCRLGINAILSLEENQFVHDSPPINLLASLRSDVTERCDRARSAEPSNFLVLSGTQILDVLDNRDRVSDDWPAGWSQLLQGAQRGDQLELRALILALKSSDREYFRNVAKSIWRRMNHSGQIITSDQIGQFSRGELFDEPTISGLESRLGADDPYTQAALGYLFERQAKVPEDLSAALFHFWIAEQLYSGSGQSQEAVEASNRRALIARILPHDVVETVRSKVMEWRVQPTISDSVPGPQIGPDNGMIRLGQDINSLASIAPDAPLYEEMTLLRAALLWHLAKMQEPNDPENARRNYINAATLMDDLPADSSFSSELVTDWSSKLSTLHEDRLAIRTLIKALMIFERNKVEHNEEMDWQAYKNIQSALRAKLANNFDAAEDANRLQFDHYLIQDNSISWNWPDEKRAAREALEEELRLIDVLLMGKETNSNWVAQRGVAQYWLGRIALSDAKESDQAQAFKAKSIDYLKSAIDSLKAVTNNGSTDPGISFLLARAFNWIADNIDGRKQSEAYLAAEEGYANSASAFEGGSWKPPTDTTLPLLYSSYSKSLEWMSRQLQMIFYADEAQLAVSHTETDKEIVSRFWNSVQSAQQWEALRKKAETNGGGGDLVNLGPGYTLAFLGGYFRRADFNAAVPNCDKHASAMVDPLRRYYSTTMAKILPQALPECMDALKSNPDDPHYKFIVSHLKDDLQLAVDAANGDYAAGFNEVAYELEQTRGYRSENWSGPLHVLDSQLRHAYTQRVLFSSFPILYEHIRADVSSEDKRRSLKWLARRAADCGVPEGHIALADLADNDAEKWIHLELAVKSMANLGMSGKNLATLRARVGIRAQTVDALRIRASQIHLPAAEIEQAQRDVGMWTPPDPLIILPADIVIQVQDAQQQERD